jgi:hypothetical protein
MQRILTVLVCSLVLATAAAAAPSRLAALDLVDPGNRLSTGEAQVLSDAMRGAIRDVLPPSRYVIMTRENIFELLPRGTDLADCIGSCAVETGRRIGADYIVTGRVGMLGDQVRVWLEIHETATANLLSIEDASGDDVTELERDLRIAAADLALVLPGAAHDHREKAREAAERQRAAAASYKRTNRLILGGAVLALAAGGYFHTSAEGHYDDHVAAADAATAASTWDSYEQGVTTRNIAVGVAGGLLLWRLLRAFGGPDDGDALAAAPGAGAIDGQVVWSHTVGFSW